MAAAERLNPNKRFKPEYFHGLGQALSFVTEHLYNLQLSPETPRNIESLKRHLEMGSAVVYINHISLDDSLLVLAFLLKEVGRSIRQIGGPESKKHYDFREGLMSGLVMRLAGLLGVTLIPVVQHYDEGKYSEKEILGSRLQFARTAKEILGKPGGILLIAPEGTRSPDGTLKQAQQGIGFVSKSSHKNDIPIFFVPIGVIPIPQGSINSGLNCNFVRSQAGRFELNMGEPFQIDFIQNTTREGITDLLMQKLASLLPQETRGVYGCKAQPDEV